MTGDELLKYAPLVLGVGSAAIRRLPAIATAARGRHEVPSGVGPGIRVASYRMKPPWGEHLDRRVRGDANTTGLRRRSITVTSLGTMATILAYVAYLIEVQARALPGWSFVVATLLTAAIVASTARVLRSLRVNRSQYTAAVEQSGLIVVHGEVEEVMQYSLGALRNIGAQVIAIDQDGRRVRAATGLSVIGNFYLGEHVTVNLDELEDKRVKIDVRSLKLDYITPSRSRSNVANFLECWAFYPAKTQS